MGGAFAHGIYTSQKLLKGADSVIFLVTIYEIRILDPNSDRVEYFLSVLSFDSNPNALDIAICDVFPGRMDYGSKSHPGEMDRDRMRNVTNQMYFRARSGAAQWVPGKEVMECELDILCFRITTFEFS